ncbi:Fn3-like domain-containing protein [Micromonospora echinaurantiaca]|uniref:Fn3-like domain-containing protein n=2 Tax=Micromonospora echinaurantiaca TaxID=47857 RepID=A0A1C5K478_9ACTN|nr:Fn3-like domain-containing protein [Micromonospora echinaurantiaca]
MAATEAAPPSPAAKVKPGSGSLRMVTLVTGDTVEVSEQGGQQVPNVRHGKGREAVRFMVSQAGGRLSVVPSDAMGLLRQGKLDPRLFDVSTLLEYGHDDGKRPDLPLLVQGVSADSVAPLTDDAGGRVTRKLPSVEAAAVRQPKRSAGAFWDSMRSGNALRSGVKRIWLDGKRKALLDASVPQVGAPHAWQSGFTGRGVKVAVLDTGIDATHPDFAGRLGEVRNFSDAPDANDTVGHGTHVASTIAGTGAASGGRYKGVAPEVTLLVGKVCGGAWCDESAILAGMQWAAESGAAVANLSLGGEDTPEVDPLEQAVNDLTAQYGTLFVVAAGNDGESGDETVGSPGSADAALTVGAVDKSDQLAAFSSRGPRIGDAALKPEITAPGVGIVAANAKDGYLGEPGESYTMLQGTSMATPHVAGAVAILAQQHPDWDADQLKAVMIGTAKTHPTVGAYAQGGGRVDVARAVSQNGYATPPTISAGLAAYPHHDDPPINKTITYHNPGSQQVTYQLSLRSQAPDGQPAPAGMFTTSTQTVTVPAGGTATVDVTVDTRAQTQYGHHSAWLTATAGETQVTTPIAVTVEEERYNLTVNLTDRNGAPATNYFLRFVDIDEVKDRATFYGGNGSVTVRLPRGRYQVSAAVETGDDEHTSLLTWPDYNLTAGGTVAFDARAAKINSITLPDPEAKLAVGSVGYSQVSGTGRMDIGDSVQTSNLSRMSSAQFGPDVPENRMSSWIAGMWGTPDNNGDMRHGPRAYYLTYYEYGHLLGGFSKNVQAGELAAIRVDYHNDSTAKSGAKAWYSQPAEMLMEFPVLLGRGDLPMQLPFSRTEYLNTDGVRWFASLHYPDGAYLVSDEATYQPGRDYHETWNGSVFAPRFPSPGYVRHMTGHTGPVRAHNNIWIQIPMRSDGAGHAGVPAKTNTGWTRLYRNGEQVGEYHLPGYGLFEVPPDEADYRLTVNARDSGSHYSTDVSCIWTFRSSHTTERQALPLITVSFTPKVDLENRAESGHSQMVPVTVRNTNNELVSTQSLTVEASFDDGHSWNPVEVELQSTGQWLAKIDHPTGKEYVSLRTTAEDKQGNTVTQTVIRAYGLT